MQLIRLSDIVDTVTEEMKRGRGRPRTEDPRTEMLHVRVTQGERDLLDEASGDTPTTTWVREKAIAAAKRKRS